MEIQEFVQYIRHPKAIAKLGGHVPKVIAYLLEQFNKYVALYACVYECIE